MATKRPHAAMSTPAPEEEPVDPSDELTFIALGGGNEVGRSCHIIQYKGKTVMLDAGIHPAYDGFAALPFYDEFDLSTVDVLLITHFHMDHVASLPYVLAKTNFAGRVYMTHPTKAIYKHLMTDSVRVQNTHTSAASSATSGTDGYVAQLFNEQDVLSTLPSINTISFHTTHIHNGIKFTSFPAGHVLGACMYVIEIAGLKILFTGDYSREDNRHLMPATLPANLHIDCLITESTFGISSHVPRAEREAGLLRAITSILSRGGRALLPTFALGGAQELLLILEDYWSRHPELQQFPIYFASSLARKCMVVYQTYIDAMSDSIRAQFQAAQANPNGEGGPWDFKYVRSLKSLDRFEDVGGCVMLASPGMLQNGVSRALLERWAPDLRNGVIITGYSVEGTMAKNIMLEPESIPAVMTNNRQNAASALMGKRAGVEENPMIPRRCTVQEFSFAAHVDGTENRTFIEEVGAPVVILVHGERHNMSRLRSRLLSLGKDMKVFSPANCEELKIPFRRDKIARVVGRLANEITPPTATLQQPSPPASDEEGDVKKRKDESAGQIISGVLVQNDFKLSLMAPEDLKEYAGLSTTTIFCRQRITLAAAGIDLIKWALESTFGSIDVEEADELAESPSKDSTREGKHTKTIMRIMGSAVTLIHHGTPHGEVGLEWEGNAANDSIADAVMAVLLSVESSPAALKQSSSVHSHSHTHDSSREPEQQDSHYDPFGDDTPPAGATSENGANHKDHQNKQVRNRNPFAASTPEQTLSRVFMFLEAQFGEDALTPIAEPKLTSPPSSADADTSMSDDEDPVAHQKAVANELARLHGLGIPVPGVEIRVNKHVARVWLEKLEVECGNRVLGDRVRAVLERAVETVSPLWR